MVRHTSQTWHRWGRVARPLVVLCSLVGGREAAAYDKRPDLQIGWPGSYSGQPVDPDPSVVPYSFYVYNEGELAEWDPETRTWTPPLGGPAYNVVAKVFLPPEVTFVSAVNTNCWTCTQSNGAVTCTGYKLANAASVDILLAVRVPTVDPNCLPSDTRFYAIPMVVDPSNTIGERNEGNNTGTGLAGYVCLN